MNKKNYYEILQINKSASAEQIKSAYRRLAKKYHPDLNPGKPYASSKFMELDEAYDTLKDPTLKKRYDRTLSGTNFSHNRNNQQHKQQQQKTKRKTRKSTRRKGPWDEEMRAHNARRKNNNYTSEREEREAREKYTKQSYQQKSKEDQYTGGIKPKGNWGFWSYIGSIWVIIGSFIAFLGEGYASNWPLIWRMVASFVCFFYILALLYELNLFELKFLKNFKKIYTQIKDRTSFVGNFLNLEGFRKLIANLKSSISSDKKNTNIKEAWKEGGFSFHGNSLFLIVASIVCLIQETIIGKFIGIIGLLFFGSIYATSAYFAYKTFFDRLFKKRK